MLNRKENSLRQKYGEKYGDILYRLFRALKNIKLPKAINNCIGPFKEEYEELQQQRQERLTVVEYFRTEIASHD
jgi:hypothetical protein